MKLDCGHEPSEHFEMFTGYGTDEQGKTACYACCAEKDKAQMRKDGKTVLYLSQKKEGWEAGNWPGSLRIPIHYHKVGRHNMAGKRYDVWFTFEGKTWHGTQYGDMTQLLHCKQVKEELAK